MHICQLDRENLAPLMLHEMSKVIQLIAVLTTVVAIALANEELFGNLKDRSTKEAHGREISVADRIRSYQAQALHSVSSVFETVQFKNDTHGKLAPSARIKPAEDALPDINELRQLLVPKIKVPDVFALATAAPAFTCQSLPQPYDPHYFCAGVVDYPFIVADGVTVLDMEMQARQAVMYLTSFINAPCLSDMKRLLCSSLYQPCVGNGTFSDVEFCIYSSLYTVLALGTHFALVVLRSLCSGGWQCGFVHADGGSSSGDSVHQALRVSSLNSCRVAVPVNWHVYVRLWVA